MTARRSWLGIYPAGCLKDSDTPQTRWANILWRSWQDGTIYNPERHNAFQRVLNQTTPNAA